MSEAPNRGQVNTDQVNQNQRRFMRNAAMTLAAAELVTISSAVALPGKKNDKDMTPAIPGTNGSSGTTFGPLKQIDAGLLNVGYAEAGPANGPAVLLLHGWPYDIYSFVDVTPLLASAGYHVFVPYLRGYGTTGFLFDDTFRNGQPSVVAVDIINLMDALKIDKAIIAGFDWGARTADIIAVLWPERCKGIVSVSGYLIGSQESGKAPRQEFSAMKHYLRFEAWIRRAPSVAVFTGVLVLAGWGTGFVTRFSVVKTANADSLPFVGDEGAMPDLDGAIGWLNSAPLSRKSLRGKVVLVNFWTYTCINSLRPLPYVKSWASKYHDAGFVVIGAHTPEFSFEHEPANVENAVRTLNVTFPVAIDSKYGIWQSFNNEVWPAQYLVDAKGRIRYHHFGEDEYGEIESVIRELLKENGATGLASGTTSLSGVGIEAAPDWTDERSPETYIGYRQAQNFASPEKVHKDSTQIFSAPGKFSLNHWGLSGSWNVNAESAVLQSLPGKIVFRFHSRDLNLVLSPAQDGKPVRFVVRLDGTAPRENSGVDTGPDGSGEIRGPRLYQLIRQKGPIVDRTFEIEFLGLGVHALDFTFG